MIDQKACRMFNLDDLTAVLERRTPRIRTRAHSKGTISAFEYPLVHIRGVLHSTVTVESVRGKFALPEGSRKCKCKDEFVSVRDNLRRTRCPRSSTAARFSGPWSSSTTCTCTFATDWGGGWTDGENHVMVTTFPVPGRRYSVRPESHT